MQTDHKTGIPSYSHSLNLWRKAITDMIKNIQQTFSADCISVFQQIVLACFSRLY